MSQIAEGPRAAPRSLRRAAKQTVLALESLKYSLLDHLPGWLADPWDDRLGRLVLGLQSIRSDWDVGAMKGLACSRSVWLGHAAFAHALTLYYRPRVIVDLGVFAGCSSIAMGLALKQLGRGKVYAVDTWMGDEHTGAYGGHVYEQFLEDIRTLGLEDHVVPLRMLFSEAAGQIDGPVDLLHVDGLHTFAAARRDFLQFRDRLSPGAPVLFHDVYNRGFPGMLLLWQWLAWRYRTYRLKHASGLGILLARGGDRTLGLPHLPRLIHLYEYLRRRIDAPEGALVAQDV